jgi:hypothetical protein
MAMAAGDIFSSYFGSSARAGLKRMKLMSAIVAGLAMGFLSKYIIGVVGGSVRSALGYIKNVNAGGDYGNFREELYRLRAVLTNIRVQFGLMLIDILRLGDALRAMQSILLRVVNVFMWFRESPKAQFAALLVVLVAISAAVAAIGVAAVLAGMALAAMAGVALGTVAVAFLAVFAVILQIALLIGLFLISVGAMMNKFGGKGFLEGGLIKTLIKGIETMASLLPEPKAGVDLGGGGGLSSRMGGAALEGSVEAYRTIQGTLMRYAAETAKNTKEAAGALKQILNRAPAMGVVAG